jgi:L-malate glycosyltransferase
MKIGITCYPTYGGSGIVGAELGLELARRGHSVHFISYAPPLRISDKPHECVQFHQVDMFAYPLFEYPPYTDALASKIRDVALAENLDLIHVHYAIPHAVSAYLAREMLRKERYLPVVTTLHGTDITLVGQHPSFLSITQFSIEQSDAVTSISKYLRSATWERFCVSCKIDVIYNFIDADYYRRTPEEELKRRVAPNGEKIILHVSTFRPVKRITDCVEMLARMRDLEQGAGRELRVKLVMCGDGPEREGAESLAASLGLSEAVLFAGKQPQSVIREYLSIADLFVLPSQTESFGLVALEAMACEVPVIATRVGGLPEVVIEGETGYLFEVGEVNAMAVAALRVVGDEGERERLGRRGREVALARFTTENIIPQYEKVYESVMRKQK